MDTWWPTTSISFYTHCTTSHTMAHNTPPQHSTPHHTTAHHSTPHQTTCHSFTITHTTYLKPQDEVELVEVKVALPMDPSKRQHSIDRNELSAMLNTPTSPLQRQEHTIHTKAGDLYAVSFGNLQNPLALFLQGYPGKHHWMMVMVRWQ